MSTLTDLEEAASQIIKEKKVEVTVDDLEVKLEGYNAVSFANGILFACKALA